MTGQSRALRIADSVAHHRVAWPGLYPLYVVTDDGGILCPDCCRSERRQIACSYPGDGWRVIAMQALFDDTEMLCSHCAAVIGALDKSEELDDPPAPNS